LRRDNERISAENHDTRKEIEFQDVRNQELVL